jgi:hypothetical protein
LNKFLPIQASSCGKKKTLKKPEEALEGEHREGGV